MSDTRIYVAEFIFGTPRLAWFVVEEETDRFYTVKPGSGGNLLGHIWVGRRIKKRGGSRFTFRTKHEALTYLATMAGQQVYDLRPIAEAAAETEATLARMASECGDE